MDRTLVHKPLLTESIPPIIGFCLSVSFTKFITFRIAHLRSTDQLKNMALFLFMLVLNYLLLIFWLPIFVSIRYMFPFVLHIGLSLLASQPVAEPLSRLGETIKVLYEENFTTHFEILYPKGVVGLFYRFCERDVSRRVCS